MIIAFVILLSYCFYLHISKADLDDVPKDVSDKVDILIKSHYKPIVEEYVKLKGGKNFELQSNGFQWGILNPYGEGFVSYKNLELELEKLKRDIERNCPCPKTKVRSKKK